MTTWNGSKEALIDSLFLMLSLVLAMTVATVMMTKVAYPKEQYPDQYAAYSDKARAWFRAVRSRQGVPCCDIADGHITSWMVGNVGPKQSGYEVPIGTNADGKPHMVPVPPEAVIENANKPDDVEESVVWYVKQGTYVDEQGESHTDYYIRCFVPGEGG